MARRLVESVTGIGSIHAGDMVLRATGYQISFWSDDGADGRVGPATQVDGRIDISGIAEAAVLSGVERLTLTLADGREIPIRLRSSGGDVVGA